MITDGAMVSMGATHRVADPEGYSAALAPTFAPDALDAAAAATDIGADKVMHVCVGVEHVVLGHT
eukprot:COSAG05_NODE_5291_length_1215_cov_0.989247_2_plen_65_part_00